MRLLPTGWFALVPLVLGFLSFLACTAQRCCQLKNGVITCTFDLASLLPISLQSVMAVALPTVLHMLCIVPVVVLFSSAMMKYETFFSKQLLKFSPWEP